MLAGVELLTQISLERGYFLRREAVELGVDDRTLHRGVRTGELVRIRQGAYSPVRLWKGQSATQRHLARACASQDLTRHDVALSHVSALAHFGCPLWEAPLDDVHLTRLDDRASRREASVAHHRGTLADSDVTEHDGRLVTTPLRTVLDATTVLSVESGMVAGDWMLANLNIDPAALWAAKTAMNHWPGTLRQEVTIRLLDGRSESVGETRARHVFWLMGLPRPVLQCPIVDERGVVIAVTDFGWPEHGVYGEFDGRIKYGRLLKPGQEPGEVVFLEKRREDEIRAVTGGTMVRLVWQELHRESRPMRRLRSLLLAAA